MNGWASCSLAQLKLTREWERKKTFERTPLGWIDNNWIELNFVDIYRLFIQCEAAPNENDERKWTEIERIESKIDTRNGFELTGHLLERCLASAESMSICRHFRSSYVYNAKPILRRFRRYGGSPSILPGLLYVSVYSSINITSLLLRFDDLGCDEIKLDTHTSMT